MTQKVSLHLFDLIFCVTCKEINKKSIENIIKLAMNEKTIIDVIILSETLTMDFKGMTDQCINSLRASEDPEKIQFNIVVIESNKGIKGFQYEHAVTIYPETEFGYHKYMNMGIALTFSSYVCLCNNDLVFHPNWASNLLEAFREYELVSACPACSLHHPSMGYELNSGIYPGYKVRHEISGWCIMLKRELLKLIGRLDENYQFWCSDNDFANTLWVLDQRHALVTSSIVDHLRSITLSTLTPDHQQAIIDEDLGYFKKKWNSRKAYTGWTSLD